MLLFMISKETKQANFRKPKLPMKIPYGIFRKSQRDKKSARGVRLELTISRYVIAVRTRASCKMSHISS